MKINFFKMHGTGNDYIFIDCIKDQIILENISTISIKLSNRHFGIGADGIVLILPSEVANIKMRMFNSDGSEGNMCGNAIRCIAKYVYEKKYTENTHITIETLSGIKDLWISENKGKVSQVEVDMGKPIFDPKLIPAISTKKIILNEKIIIDYTIYNITCLSMGNPHCVVFVDDLENLDLNKIGPMFENNNRFSNRINTEFIKILSENEISMRVWERGSGETLSCGTGACAAAVASILNKFCNYDSDILIHLIGGILTVKYKQDGNVYLKGPAECVYEGIVEID
ncbi:MAG: diaminopimelate epimerase [Clostridia bacterium]|nr:diaminopimelate epimerase [Clostridia bacterium]MDD4386582.1 diaminopimelate epimerase [Clostridia bacterium]